MVFPKLKKLRTPIAAMLAFAVLSIGVLSASLMHSNVCIDDSCGASVCQSVDRGVPSADLACLNHCVSAVLSSVQSAPVNNGTNLYLLLLAVVFCLLLFSLDSGISKNLKLPKTRLRQFYEQSKTAFFLQLGFWLSLIEKKDYSYVLVLT